MISAYGVHPDITRAGDYMFRLVHLGAPQGARPRCISARRLASRKSPPSPWITITAKRRWMVFSRGRQIRYRGSQQIQLFAEGSPVRLDRCQRQARQSRRDLRHRIFFHRRAAGRTIARRRRHRTHYRLAGVRLRKVHRHCRALRPRACKSSTLSTATATTLALKKFFDEFTTKAGYPPESVAAVTYSAVMLMADGIKRAGSDDPAKVRDALAATKNFPMLEGNLNRLQQPARNHHADEHQRDQGRQIHRRRRDHRSRRLRAPREIGSKRANAPPFERTDACITSTSR